MIFELDRLHFEAAQTRVGCIVRQHEEVLRKRVGETDRKHLTRVVILISKPSMPLIERDQDGALATSLSTKDKTSLVTNANWRGDRGDRDRRAQAIAAPKFLPVVDALLLVGTFVLCFGPSVLRLLRTLHRKTWFAR